MTPIHEVIFCAIIGNITSIGEVIFRIKHPFHCIAMEVTLLEMYYNIHIRW